MAGACGAWGRGCEDDRLEGEHDTGKGEVLKGNSTGSSRVEAS